MNNLNNKVAIVTGGGAGLGRAISIRLAREGACVAVIGRHMDSLQETAQILRQQDVDVLPVVCDVCDSASVGNMANAVMKHFGHIDYLVNNVGRAFESRSSLRLCDTEDTLWNESVSLNLNSVFYCCKHVIPLMIQSGGGAICNISSVAAYFPAFGASYGATKAAVLALTKSVAMQYADDNIRCNAVCPGPMNTPGGMTANGTGIYAHQTARTRMIQRVSDPLEIANVVLFLLSDEASYITGTEIKADGGSMALSVFIPPRSK